MPITDYTHLTLVVDRSGSMSSIRTDAEGGIKTLLTEQFAEDGKLTVTLVDFDETSNTVTRFSDAPIEYHLQPRGCTALFDAVGSEIIRTGQDLAALPEDQRPDQVLFVVVTDGQENSSREFPIERVRELIAQQRDQYKWVFQFLGADESAWQGQEMGMQSARFSHDSKGQSAAYLALNDSMKRIRKMKEEAFDLASFIDDDYEPEQKPE